MESEIGHGTNFIIVLPMNIEKEGEIKKEGKQENFKKIYGKRSKIH